MSLQWQLARQVPSDTAQLGQTLLAPDNVYRQIGDRFDELFPTDGFFAELYETTGRGAISPVLLAVVTVLQMLEKTPDRQAAEWVVSRIDWKYALHLPLTYTGFHFTDLYAFRGRLLAHQQERQLFEDVLGKLKTLGWIKRRGKMRTDSTHLLAVVEHLSQLELVAESLRVALRAVTTLAPDWAQASLPATFREECSRRQTGYGLNDQEVLTHLVQAGQDSFWFLAQVDHSAPPSVHDLAELQVLRTVLEQQFPSGAGGPPATRRPTGGEIIESPHEPEARFGSKRGKGWIGYKVQVTETCDTDQPHLIVDIEPTGATANDSPELPKIQARLKERDVLPSEQQVDQGYMSGQRMAQSADLGINLMGVPLDDTQGPDGFRQDDFKMDEAAQHATCPAGHTSVVWSEHPVPGAPALQVKLRFDAPTCQACPFFGQCTTSSQGRSLTLHPYRALLAQRRAEAQSEDFKHRLHLRAGIEGTLSELVRGHRLRWARFRGQAKLRLQAYFTAIAVNLKRVTRWWARLQTVTAEAAAIA